MADDTLRVVPPALASLAMALFRPGQDDVPRVGVPPAALIPSLLAVLHNDPDRPHVYATRLGTAFAEDDPLAAVVGRDKERLRAVRGQLERQGAIDDATLQALETMTLQVQNSGSYLDLVALDVKDDEEHDFRRWRAELQVWTAVLGNSCCLPSLSTAFDRCP
jgi:hypothetical protein